MLLSKINDDYFCRVDSHDLAMKECTAVASTQTQYEVMSSLQTEESV